MAKHGADPSCKAHIWTVSSTGMTKPISISISSVSILWGKEEEEVVVVVVVVVLLSPCSLHTSKWMFIRLMSHSEECNKLIRLLKPQSINQAWNKKLHWACRWSKPAVSVRTEQHFFIQDEEKSSTKGVSLLLTGFGVWWNALCRRTPRAGKGFQAATSPLPTTQPATKGSVVLLLTHSTGSKEFLPGQVFSVTKGSSITSQAVFIFFLLSFTDFDGLLPGRMEKKKQMDTWSTWNYSCAYNHQFYHMSLCKQKLFSLYRKRLLANSKTSVKTKTQGLDIFVDFSCFVCLFFSKKITPQIWIRIFYWSAGGELPLFQILSATTNN